jgi:hypothetical protein
MRNILKFALIVAFLVSPGVANATTNLLAKDHRIGIGLGGGTFTSGLSGKLFLGERLSAQATAGTWWGYGLAANAEVLVEMPQITQASVLGLNWYVGAGAGAVVGTSLALAVNGVAGLSAQLTKIPLEITAEFRPTFIVADGWGGFMWGGGGGAVRYYF